MLNRLFAPSVVKHRAGAALFGRVPSAAASSSAPVNKNYGAVKYPTPLKTGRPDDFLSISDLTGDQIHEILDVSAHLKMMPAHWQLNVLRGRTMAMIFEKPSLRTRVSFEAGMTQLGGHAIFLGSHDIAINATRNAREPIWDVAEVMSGMADLVMARVFEHETVEQLAKFSSVPVINGLSDLEHPCQVMGDLLTLREHKRGGDRDLSGLTVAFVGDGNNNVTHSLALACSKLGINFRVASPSGYHMNKEIAMQAALNIGKGSGVQLLETEDPAEAVTGADVVYTDTWVSMGAEEETASRLAEFQPYRVTEKLMELAKTDAIFMHDMPISRENEVDPAVCDGPQSVKIPQAHNRLHAQKGVITWLMSLEDTMH